MKVEKVDIEGLLVITPNIFKDSRGYFIESYNENNFQKEAGLIKFVQDNESCSSRHILRGLHFQSPPFDQGKLVRVVRGSVLDVVVDIRKSSPTYGKHFSIELNENNKKQLWIPPGFAHGFLSLQDDTIFLYKCTNFYHGPSEGSIIWNDPTLNITWGVTNPLVSDKDGKGMSFDAFDSPFI